VTLLIFFFPLPEMLAGAKVLMVALWFWASTSKLNRHFPFVVAIMLSNSPLVPSKRFKRALYRDYPDDLIPSRLARLLAHAATFVELVVPLVLLWSRGGPVTVIALVAIVLFHLHIIAAVPMGVPLEWNIFFIFASLSLFGAHAGVSPLTIRSPLLLALLLVTVVVIPVLGTLRPGSVSFLPAMRYYAGNWATTLWCFRDDAERKLDAHITKAAPVLDQQLERIYGPELAELMQQKGLAWRALHAHGRALNGLLPRALDDVGDYVVREGEFTAGVLLGWNFGDGHLHDEQLLAAVQERCSFEPGELRLVILESEPARSGVQHFRLVDAATGPIEQGDVAVADMVTRQPWLDDEGTIPVANVRRAGGDGRIPAMARSAS
jgi:hypothetical protein